VPQGAAEKIKRTNDVHLRQLGSQKKLRTYKLGAAEKKKRSDASK
jgi:hypothetical protein